MSLYNGVSDLRLTVEDWGFEVLEKEVSGGFRRVTTEIELRGGEIGRGEDVTYAEEHHTSRELEEVELPLEGAHTVRSFSELLDGLRLFPGGAEREQFESYRRWGFESAALDLALRQNGKDLEEALGLEYSPVRFVVSPRLGDPPIADPVHELLDRDPGLEFKLDASTDWNDDLIRELAATDAVRTVDLKGLYAEDVEVAQPADPDLYRRVVEGFPDAHIEDPRVTDETRPVLEPASDRITWDKPITGVESVRELPFEPSTLNIKPSRFGSLESLLNTVDYCQVRGIGMYGGGQFELGVGRGQVQALASLFYPDSPNDVSPRDYHSGRPGPGAPRSPLEPPRDRRGFGWG